MRRNLDINNSTVAVIAATAPTITSKENKALRLGQSLRATYSSCSILLLCFHATIINPQETKQNEDLKQ